MHSLFIITIITNYISLGLVNNKYFNTQGWNRFWIDVIETFVFLSKYCINYIALLSQRALESMAMEQIVFSGFQRELYY